jgi:hypothetical protein
VKLPRGASGCVAGEQSATQAKADKKEREKRWSGAKPTDSQHCVQEQPSRSTGGARLESSAGIHSQFSGSQGL